MKKHRLIRAIYSQTSDKLGRVSRKRWRNKRDNRRLKNRNFTIFAQNCIGGIMYHDTMSEFCSPTVNMLFKPNDFVKFLEKPEYYVEREITFIESDKRYPIGLLDNEIYIAFLHYHSKQEVVDSWKRRAERINWDNIFVIACDCGKEMDYENIVKFDQMDRYKNKIIFTSKPMPEIRSSIYAKSFPDGADARLLNFADLLGKRYYEKYIDYVAWLNKEL